MQRYSFAKRGVVTVTAEVKRNTCNTLDYYARDDILVPRDDESPEVIRDWLYVIVIILALT